ncbi:dihydrofolate reductase [Paenibacillus hemerocallicola]|nr:dihydrofolate reductase [Paenibacillus hemerocallicola]
MNMKQTGDVGGTSPNVAMIAAMDRNRVIGKSNAIPWRLPAEQQYFKRITMGHTVLTGRLNYEAMKRPLAGRTNVVMTRDQAFAADGCEVVRTVDEALARYAGNANSPLFVIGGEQIYRLFLPVAHTLYLTVIDETFDGDTYFPELDPAEWNEISRERGATDEQNRHAYVYYVYRRTSAGSGE